MSSETEKTKQKSAFGYLKEFGKDYLVSLKLIGLLTILLIFFHKPILKAYTLLVIQPVLSYYAQTWLSDIFLTLICFAAFSFGIIKTRKIHNHLPGKHFVCFSLYFIFLYLMVRNTQTGIVYYKYLNFEWLSITDFIVACLGLFLLSTFIYSWITLKKRKSPELKNNSESPKEELAQDDLNRELFAKTTFEYIQAKKNLKNSTAIGINGKWGDGKTTFMHLIKRCIEEKEDEYIIMDFNPWLSSTPKSLITDFFNTLQKELAGYNPAIKFLSKSYAQILIKYYDKNNALESLADLIMGTPITLQEKFSKLQTELAKIPKQIVICIDDLDRLDKEEIIEVIRLIRNTANFSKTVFLVTYDKEYIVSALKGINEYGADCYLEKIFQTEIKLPAIETKDLKKKLKALITDLTGEDISSWFDTLYPEESHQNPLFESYFKNLRDVTQFANKFSLPYRQVRGDVNPVHFYYLQLLDFRYPEIYNLLKEDGFNLDWYNSRFLTISDFSDIGNVIHLKPIDSDKVEFEKKTCINKYFDIHDFNEKDIDAINRILKKLFPYNLSYAGVNLTEPDTHNDIYFSINFRKYFAIRNLENNIPKSEIEDAFQLSQSKLNEKIEHWVKEKKYESLECYFKTTDKFESREKYEKIIRAILLFGSLPHPDSPRTFLSFNENRFRVLIDFEKVKSFYSQSEHRDFLLSAFSEVPDPALFASYISRRLVNFPIQLNDKYIPSISSEDMMQLRLQYFENYLKKCESINNSLFMLFHNAKKDRQGNYTEAKNLFIEFAENKDFKNFLKSLISPIPDEIFQPRHYEISSLTWELFDNYQNFELFLNKNKNEEAYFEEFFNFYNLCINVGFNSVAFNFNEFTFE